MTVTGFGAAVWRKSSYSSSQGNCVEVATGPALVGVRDSKAPEGGLVAVPAEVFSALLAAVRR